MYDAGKIVTGLVIFLVALTFPVWYDAATNAAAAKPDPVIVTQEKNCVLPTEEMRAAHMTLLDSWRDQVVRQGETVFVAADGKQYDMSLTGTCLKCHTNKAEFCDRCHDYAQAKPACWDCHTAPKEKTI
jgi:hypothetical protein